MYDMKRTYIKRTPLKADAKAVFDWHHTADALNKLIPPNEGIQVVEQKGSISEEGSTTTLAIPFIGPLKVTWVSRHHNYRDEETFKQFMDTQVKGPFNHWVHAHKVLKNGDQCILEDEIEYELPLGFVGDLFGHWLVKRKLDAMFDYRHRVMQQVFSESE